MWVRHRINYRVSWCTLLPQNQHISRCICATPKRPSWLLHSQIGCRADSCPGRAGAWPRVQGAVSLGGHMQPMGCVAGHVDILGDLQHPGALRERQPHQSLVPQRCEGATLHAEQASDRRPTCSPTPAAAKSTIASAYSRTGSCSCSSLAYSTKKSTSKGRVGEADRRSCGGDRADEVHTDCLSCDGHRDHPHRNALLSLRHRQHHQRGLASAE